MINFCNLTVSLKPSARIGSNYQELILSFSSSSLYLITMPKTSQKPSKAKSSIKAKSKAKILKPKLKKNAKPSREPISTDALSPSISSTIPISSIPYSYYSCYSYHFHLLCTLSFKNNYPCT